MKKIVTVALATIVFGVICLAAASVVAAGEPEDLLEVWQTTLIDEDYPAYLDCLHSGARGVPEYGSREAMRFWTREMERLREQGFSGRFAVEVAATTGPRFPEGTLLAHPIVDGEPIRDAIVLIQEAGRWKILRLFS